MIEDYIGYPTGSDLTFLNSFYLYPKKDQQTGKWDNGSLTIVFIDNETKEKKHVTIENPDYEYYILKPELPVNYNRLFADKKDVIKRVCPYKDLLKDIAQVTDNLEFYYDNIKSGNRSANNMLHTHERIFMSDMNIEDHYRLRFAKAYSNKMVPPSKAFFDIEADTRTMKGDFPEMGECPINAITIVLEKENKTFTFLLRDYNNPQMIEFEKNASKYKKELKDFIRQEVGGWKNEYRYHLQDIEYEFLFYDTEIELLVSLFNLINSYEPDFLFAWNMAFDIPYIIQRLINIGYKPEDVICHKAFENKYVDYYVDKRMENEYAERGDFARISANTVYLDQMIHFASRRKSQKAFTKFSLDYIAEKVTKGVFRKLDYSDITTDISELPVLNYKVFVFYNIFDTLSQKCIEEKSKDTEYLLSKSLANCTRYHKVHRQTKYLTNRGAFEFWQQGFIMGNNTNIFNKKPDVKYPGALVGDPLNLNDYSKVKINGIPINVCDNLDDFDYSSLYPSIIREFNIAHNTQIGMVQIEATEFLDPKRLNSLGRENFTLSSGFMEDLQSQVYLEFCTRWFNLADYATLLDDISEYFREVRVPIYGFRNTNPIMGTFSAGIIFGNNAKVAPAMIFDKNVCAGQVIQQLNNDIIGSIYSEVRKDG